MSETFSDTYTERHAGDIIERLDTFLRDYYRDDLGELILAYPDESSLTIDYSDVFRFDPDIADDLLDQPNSMMEYFEEAVRTYDYPIDTTPSNAHVRVENLPEEHQYIVGEYRSDDIGNYLGVRGQVTKRTSVKPRVVEALFECQRCGTKKRVPQADDGGFQEPHECDGCERQGPFHVDFSQSELRDHQMVQIQQPPEETNGADGTSIDVTLSDDLVNSVKPGDRVTTNGVLRLEQGSDADDSPVFDQYIDAQSTELEETDFEEIDVSEHIEEVRSLASRDDAFELLRDSIAPGIIGEKQERIKSGIVLQLFGGNRSRKPDGTVVRGDIHLLALGDPGTGKSALLRAVENLAPRSTYTSGKGASKAGMTAAAVPDDFGGSKWSLEAGALVLANKGVACVDEIDKVQEDAVSSLHGALESPQQVEIHKAGINATLPSRTSLLAAGNPKYGRFDPYENFGQQFDLGPTLLSRFDLIYTVSDSPDEEKDREIAEANVQGRQLAHQYDDNRDLSEEERAEIEPPVSADVFRAWIAYARQNVRPTMPDPVKEMVEEAYVTFRNEVNSGEDEGPDPIPITVRKIDGIQRLAEASARARLSETVTESDVHRATSLIRKCLEDVGKDPETGEFDADIVESGAPKSQQTRKRAVMSAIESECGGKGERAPVSDVLDALEEQDYDPANCAQDIEEFAKAGEFLKYVLGDEEVIEWT